MGRQMCSQRYCRLAAASMVLATTVLGILAATRSLTRDVTSYEVEVGRRNDSVGAYSFSNAPPGSVGELAVKLAAVDSNTKAGNARDTADSIVERMSVAADRLRTFQADLQVSSRNLQVGGRPDTSTGKVYAQRSNSDDRDFDRLRVSYAGPPAKHILLLGDQVDIYEPQLNQVIRQSTESAEDKYIQGYLRLGEESNDTVYVGGTRALAILKVVPKSPDKIKSARIWVSRANWLPSKFEIYYTNTALTITLSNARINQRLPPSVFKINYPRDVAVVRR
jgi:outer membrane lipoprotein-sorting protein